MVELPRFRLEPGEPLGSGLQRICLTEIEDAISGFYDGEETFGLAVHQARKSMKRLRALLRLVRFEIGERAYDYENEALRETARLISGVRSAAVSVEAVNEVLGLYGGLLAQGTFDELVHNLELRRDRTEERVMSDPEIIPRVVEDLEKAHLRFSSWPTAPDARAVYGVGIRDSYEAVGPGLHHTYRRGRREMVTAYHQPRPVHFHLWRKRVKYLRHQFEILTPLWPEVMLGMALVFERIGDLLGEDHDLADVLRLVTDRPDICSSPVERSLLTALAQQRRSDLQTASRILGRRVFAESPDSLTARVEAYWESARMASSFTPGTFTG